MGEPESDHLEDVWVLTGHGKQFYLADPDASLIDIEDIANTLANICRFNGRTKGFYSVAQHSILVSEICADDPLAGLLHDAAEAYIGDVIRPLKKLLKGVDQIETAITREIGSALSVDYERLRHPRIKHADDVALATEIRDLMPDWPETTDRRPQPAALRIVPLRPGLARKAFLARYRELSRVV
jgi:5'-deoxynucleotidase YfbR-like HD superfamily hydrolase